MLKTVLKLEKYKSKIENENNRLMRKSETPA